jgi:hypothetical protein
LKRRLSIFLIDYTGAPAEQLSRGAAAAPGSVATAPTRVSTAPRKCLQSGSQVSQKFHSYIFPLYNCSLPVVLTNVPV